MFDDPKEEEKRLAAYPHIKFVLQTLTKLGLGAIALSAVIGAMYLFGRAGFYFMRLLIDLPETMKSVPNFAASLLGLMFIVCVIVMGTVIGHLMFVIGSEIYYVITGKRS